MSHVQSTTESDHPNVKLSKADWISAARKILIEEGVGRIRLRRLSESLDVTTGAFYWLYKGLKELHADLRSDWADRNTQPFIDASNLAGSDGWQQYLAYVRVLMLDGDYDPLYDNAIRDWAHSSTQTANILQEIDILRIELLRKIFVAMGFDNHAALIRARVTYFHQTGYQSMRIEESLEDRLANVPFFAEVLTGSRHLFALDGAEAVRAALLKTLP
jgi:AcrR family transcriptional regulator